MPKIVVEDNKPDVLAVALEDTDLTDFVISHALRATKAVIDEADH